MGVTALSLLGLPVLLVGGLAAQQTPARTSKAQPCCGGAACIDQATPRQAVAVNDNCPPCLPCPQRDCPPCEECP
jgi:hypothetical protein